LKVFAGETRACEGEAENCLSEASFFRAEQVRSVAAKRFTGLDFLLTFWSSKK